MQVLYRQKLPESTPQHPAFTPTPRSSCRESRRKVKEFLGAMKKQRVKSSCPEIKEKGPKVGGGARR